MEYYKEFDIFDFPFWAGAIDRIDRLIAQERMQEASEIIINNFTGYIPSEVEINDFVWFELDDIMNLYN